MCLARTHRIGALAILLGGLPALTFLWAAACSDDDGGTPLDRYGSCPTEWRTYPHAPAGTDIRFPVDEGAHYLSDATVELEWWYTIYHLRSEDGRSFSVITTFFMPQIDLSFLPLNVTDVEAGVVHGNEEWGTLVAAEGDLDLSWTGANPDLPASFMRNQRDARGRVVPFAYDQGIYQVDRLDPSQPLSLELAVVVDKSPLLLGEDGYVIIGDTGESYYYTFTRMTATGTLTVGGETLAVSGTGWLDHQWGPFMITPLPISPNTYEWMGIQLDNGEEYMVSSIFDAENRLRVEEGWGGVSWKNPDCSQGQTMAQVVERLGFWKHPETGGYYSSRWRLVLPEKGLDVTIQPSVEDQTVRFLGTTFYEGRCDVVGTQNGSPVTGLAYVELMHHYQPPELRIDAPTAGASVTGVVPVAWTVQNPDDGLRPIFDVHALTGVSEVPLCEGLTETACDADLDALSGVVTIRVTGASADGTIRGTADATVLVH